MGPVHELGGTRPDGSVLGGAGWWRCRLPLGCWWSAAWRQLETDRRQLRQQLEVAGQEQASERFARALDQLGSERLDVRPGGIDGSSGSAEPGGEQAGGPVGQGHH